MARNQRTKVTIRCNVCGEKFTLRGRKEPSGEVDTGFKQCLCNNDRHFMIHEES
ncbi:hypothetical protein NDK47_15290 [Brevibacillus ruminantium]|uniref:Uncharacterized protein n=1 Tax=Brevibacillus ruminantium TaxID=2950604 RepID=A0ABY4W8N2_9BACL|nr:hypothetical protein [Brevibacillus ruminantium]USG63540.1 hypothetical protein NDK47_15290 [Brevibacillus ruminantium]